MSWVKVGNIKGPKGDKGDKGDDGDAGSGGSIILSGTAAPTGATGNVGDYYLDTDDNILYGPKVTPVTSTTGILGTPATPNQNSSQTRTYGLRFRVLTGMVVTGLRWWRGADAIETTRILKLWSDTGTELASASTSGETGQGWQTATLATPYTLVAGTFYRACFSLNNGSKFGYSGSYPAPSTPDVDSLACYYIDNVNVFPTTINAGINAFVDVVVDVYVSPPWPVALPANPTIIKGTVAPTDLTAVWIDTN